MKNIKCDTILFTFNAIPHSIWCVRILCILCWQHLRVQPNQVYQLQNFHDRRAEATEFHSYLDMNVRCQKTSHSQSAKLQKQSAQITQM